MYIKLFIQLFRLSLNFNKCLCTNVYVLQLRVGIVHKYISITLEWHMKSDTDKISMRAIVIYVNSIVWGIFERGTKGLLHRSDIYVVLRNHSNKEFFK